MKGRVLCSGAYCRRIPETRACRLPMFTQTLRNTASGLLTFCLDFRISRRTSGIRPVRFPRFVSTAGFGKTFRNQDNETRLRPTHPKHCLPISGFRAKLPEHGRRISYVWSRLPAFERNFRHTTCAHAEIDALGLAGRMPRQGSSRSKPAFVEIDPLGLPMSVSRRGPFQGKPAHVEIDPFALPGPVPRQGPFRGKPLYVEIDPFGFPGSVSRQGSVARPFA